MPSKTGSQWTPDRVTQLGILWIEGVPVPEIIRIMDIAGLNKNMVIGKAHREGLPKRMPEHQKISRRMTKPPVVAKPVPSRAPAVLKAAVAKFVAETPKVARVKVQEQASATIFNLGAHRCKFPIGDPRAPDFGFCGKSGSPWCAHHRTIVFEPLAPRVRSEPTRVYTRARR